MSGVDEGTACGCQIVISLSLFVSVSASFASSSPSAIAIGYNSSNIMFKSALVSVLFAIPAFMALSHFTTVFANVPLLPSESSLISSSRPWNMDAISLLLGFFYR